jgi:hypothetical protein
VNQKQDWCLSQPQAVRASAFSSSMASSFETRC